MRCAAVAATNWPRSSACHRAWSPAAVTGVQERKEPGSTPITLAVFPPILIAPPLTVRTPRTPLSLRIFGTSERGIPVWMTARTSGTTSWRGICVLAVVPTVAALAPPWAPGGWGDAPNGTPMPVVPPALVNPAVIAGLVGLGWLACRRCWSR